MTFENLTLIQQEKKLKKLLESLGFSLVEEYTNDDDTVKLSKYEKLGIGVRIERNL